MTAKEVFEILLNNTTNNLSTSSSENKSHLDVSNPIIKKKGYGSSSPFVSIGHRLRELDLLLGETMAGWYTADAKLREQEESKFPHIWDIESYLQGVQECVSLAIDDFRLLSPSLPH